MHIRRSLVALLTLVCIAGLLSTSVASARPQTPSRRSLLRRATPQPTQGVRVAPNQVIVALRSESTLARRSVGASTSVLASHFRGLGIHATKQVAPDVYQLDLQAGADVWAAAKQAGADGAVRWAEPNYIYDWLRTTNDPLASFQYAPSRVNLTTAWDITTGSNGVVVAVIDTGVTFDHPDIQENLLPGYDFVEGDEEPDDDVFHGTFVSGIIAARGDNGEGIAGVCWQCRILPIRSLSSEGGTSGSVAQGIRYAVDRGARIINMSLGGTVNSTLLEEAVRYAASKNVLLVAASGNAAQDGNPVEYPAAYPEVLSVGATDGNDRIAEFSTFNGNVQLSAPGVNIASTSNEEDLLAYGAYDGTSFASPIVAGVAALMLSVNPSLSANQLKELLLATAVDLGTPGRDQFYGAGRVDALRAVQAAIPSAFTPVADPGDGGFFPETGHTLRGAFADFWNANGGLPVFGFPISEPFDELTPEGTFQVQYFERNRFEFHPENPAPNNVLLGRLGDTALLRSGRDWRRFELGDPSDPECQFFEPTGHTVCGPFLAYYQANGLNDPQLDPGARSLALFGLPLSEAQEETNSSGDTVVVQHFERARFEYHPELESQGTPVLLGLLGNELARPVFGSYPPSEPGSPAFDRCAGIPASRDGTISPSNCVLFGVTASLTINGFQPNELIAYWLTDPTGEVVAGTEDGDDLLQAEADGTLDQLDFTTSFLSPGTWYWVFQGTTSGHQSVIYFKIIDG